MGEGLYNLRDARRRLFSRCDVQDLFSENPEEAKTHEIERKDDGSVAITNVNLVPLNPNDDEEVGYSLLECVTTMACGLTRSCMYGLL